MTLVPINSHNSPKPSNLVPEKAIKLSFFNSFLIEVSE